MKDEFLSHAEAAQLNRNIVLHYVKNHGPVSRTDIWGDMSISRASVTQVIRQLQEAGLIVETGEKQSSGGRMSRSLRINDDARYMYVFDWGTHLLCLVNLAGEARASIPLSFPAACTPSAFACVVLDGVDHLRGQCPVEPETLLGLGVALPGLIDCRHMTVLYSVELGWRDVDIRYLFSKRFGNDVFLERTGNMIALGEYVYGAGRGFNHEMLVLLENEGIGVSAVVRGDCQHGNNYMFGELGHIKLPIDIMCSCGQQGCLEAVVQDHLARNGGVMDEALTEYIAFGVSTAVNLSDPGIVLLSGKLVRGLTREQETSLLSSIRGKITNERSRSLTIHICQEEGMMGVKGMSAYIFNHHFSI